MAAASSGGDGAAAAAPPPPPPPGGDGDGPPGKVDGLPPTPPADPDDLDLRSLFVNLLMRRPHGNVITVMNVNGYPATCS